MKTINNFSISKKFNISINPNDIHSQPNWTSKISDFLNLKK